jgi:hypothetical protein
MSIALEDGRFNSVFDPSIRVTTAGSTQSLRSNQTAPTPQHAVDIFAGQWSSRLPPDAPAVSHSERDVCPASHQVLLGDFVHYFRQSQERFDVCVASGMLYRMSDPGELIRLIALRSNAVYCWTHYYDAEVLSRNWRTAHWVVPGDTRTTEGFSYKLFVHKYGAVRDTSRFCGASAPNAGWMRRDDIALAFRHFGFTRFEQAFEQPDHRNGPAFAFVAGE